MLMGTLCGVEMGLSRAGVPHRRGGAQAAMDYLAAPRAAAARERAHAQLPEATAKNNRAQGTPPNSRKGCPGQIIGRRPTKPFDNSHFERPPMACWCRAVEGEEYLE